MNNLEIFIVICGAILLTVDYIVMRWCEKNVYLTYKEQKAWGK